MPFGVPIKRSFATLLTFLLTVVLAGCGSLPSGGGGGGGTQVPATPTGLQATAGNAQVSLTWNASTGATSYNVKRSTTTGGPYTKISSPTTASYTDTGLTNGTPYYYVVTALNSAGESAASSQATATPAGAQANVTITINPSNTHPISPYIYGLNFYSGVTGAPPNLTFDRDGGNRWTAYNWETNASNAGSDYLYENDNYLSSSTTPAEAVRSFIAGDQANNMASLVTFQMQGLVAGDENGPVSVTNPPDLTRFKQVVFKKSTQSSAPFTLTPPTTDNYVYMDEFIWALDQKFSGQSIFSSNPTSQHTFVQLDNEPELWNSTHLEVQGSSPITSDAYIAKTLCSHASAQGPVPRSSSPSVPFTMDSKASITGKENSAPLPPATIGSRTNISPRSKRLPPPTANLSWMSMISTGIPKPPTAAATASSISLAPR